MPGSKGFDANIHVGGPAKGGEIESPEGGYPKCNYNTQTKGGTPHTVHNGTNLAGRGFKKGTIDTPAEYPMPKHSRGDKV